MMPALILVLPIFFIFIKSTLLRAKQLPPGPNTWQLLRNLSEIGKKPHVALNNLSKIYGPLISLRLGSQLIVIASSPETAKNILKTHDRNFSGRYFPLSYYEVPRILHFTMSKECNDTWKFLRGVAQKYIFSSQAFESKGEIRKDKVMTMLNHLIDKEGEVVKIDDIVSTTVSNIISCVLASRNLFDIRGFGENDQSVKMLLSEIVELIASPGLADLFPFLERVDFWSKRNGLDMHRKVGNVWEDIIKERRLTRDNKGIPNQDFLDVLVKNGFFDDQISVLLTELLIGGTESTIITIVWLMVELIRNQEILCRIREEIEQAIEGNTFSESLLSECQYLQACVKETLRLHIPGPFLLPHRNIQKCKVNNYVIPKDSIILVNAWAIQMDSKNWKDATLFNPDRFLDSKIDFKGTHFEYIPFSAGQRMCPGFTMGFRNIQLIVAHLIHNFDWRLPDGEDPSNLDNNDKFGLTLRREKPLYLIPRPRNKLIC